ncbi:50S ribosomal protein L32 [Mycoplasma phocoenae]|uniref:Large ribosomal subunit protein bL32 n=1 Tax=Mycoplasma phocoenae TaxID=754517 RepID=A0A858U3S2_9MOLU|nr:50S ribosomal protein L32 [Mycoplasma phocoenae]QJG67120.1 50S ribosomal protein L32 [Mycoplasma phocoenae]
MAIVPKRKTSKQRKHLRRSHHALKANTYSNCTNCLEPVLPHRLCVNCGFYKGQKVAGFKAKKDK